ncbi:AAA family ATPase [Nonomuraea rhizosphaerae]|uniref:AAA family ATPase n=1 Tax=Nonomuraea rhizosphaerae TaxID=2665663 RepID=UPI001C601F27|nr:LuxR family transcriptional regulator [Nonomuraea rhizosphaerae]
MGFYERDAAMASLQRLLVETLEGRSRGAMVTGVVATGKSELLHAFAEHAYDKGALPLVATASRAERDLPLGVIGQLLHNAPLGEPLRERTTDLLRQAGDQLDTQVVEELCGVLLSLAEQLPLVIVVDDVHDSDRTSQTCLSYFMRRARSSPVMTVFGHADYTHQTDRSFPTEVMRQPHCTAIRLLPLSRGATLSMASERLGHETAERLMPEWYDLSGGNPLLVNGLIEDFSRTGCESPAESYGEAVLSCLHRADPSLLDVARWVAAIDDPALAQRLAHSDTTSVPLSIHWLETAGLLTEGRFRHEAGAAAVLADLGADKRHYMHQCAAQLLYSDGASDLAIAEQLSKADVADAPWCVPVLESAARRRLVDGDVESGVDYLKLALRGNLDDRERTVIATMLMRAEWRIDPKAPISHMEELTAALHNGTLSGSDAIVLARALLWHGKMDVACDVLERMTEFGDDPGTVAEGVGTRMWLRCTAPPLLAHMNSWAGQHISEAVLPFQVSRRLESIDTLASVLTGGPLDRAVSTAERILSSSSLDEMSMDTVESALLALVYAGRADRAAPWCDERIAELSPGRSPARRARLTAIRAEISLRRGDLEDAASYARQALELLPPGSWGVAVGGPVATLMLAATAMGRYSEALTQLNQSFPETMLQTRFGLRFLQARGRYQLAVGNPAAALRDFRLCGDLLTQWNMDAPGFIAWRTDVAAALIGLGRHDEARELAEEQLGASGPGSERTDGVALRMLAAGSEARHRPMLLRQASEYLQACGDRYELARSLVELTEAYHGVGEFRRAGIIASRARALAQECGARPLSQALAVEGTAEEGDDTGPNRVAAILSDAERRVASLATVGYSNREIAAKLFITVSTVEQHLTRVYRKLNITQRSDLPPDLKAQPGHVPAQSSGLVVGR